MRIGELNQSRDGMVWIYSVRGKNSCFLAILFYIQKSRRLCSDKLGMSISNVQTYWNRFFTKHDPT
ncbi:hypothetical protein HZS_7501 [Henneguya salminicola]|nr:hypothetical protein HZS_7501 [Henneguya salminicola]